MHILFWSFFSLCGSVLVLSLAWGLISCCSCWMVPLTSGLKRDRKAVRQNRIYSISFPFKMRSDTETIYLNAHGRQKRFICNCTIKISEVHIAVFALLVWTQLYWLCLYFLCVFLSEIVCILPEKIAASTGLTVTIPGL